MKSNNLYAAVLRRTRQNDTVSTVHSILLILAKKGINFQDSESRCTSVTLHWSIKFSQYVENNVNGVFQLLSIISQSEFLARSALKWRRARIKGDTKTQNHFDYSENLISATKPEIMIYKSNLVPWRQLLASAAAISTVASYNSATNVRAVEYRSHCRIPHTILKTPLEIDLFQRLPNSNHKLAAL